MQISRARRACRGYTLIEVAIAMGIAGLVFGALVHVLESSQDTYGQGSATARVQNDARRALDRVVFELENAGDATLNPSLAMGMAHDLQFNVPNGIDAATSTLTWDPTTRVRLVYEPGEANNGLDDDNDGLVDEGCLELTKDVGGANEVTVTIARGIAEHLEGEVAGGGDENGNGLVNERGFCLTRAGDLVQLRLTVERPVPGGRAPAVATVETAFRVKN